METLNRPHRLPHLRRVVVTGSECVGKTTLALQLGAHFGVEVVPEFVRAYAERKGQPLDADDHAAITHGQIAALDVYAARAAALLIQDTDLLSTVTYCHHYTGQCAAFIEALALTHRADLYLLLDIDVPWQADGVRDRGDRRAEVQQLFEQTLSSFGANVVRIRGGWTERAAAAISAIDALLGGRG